MTLWVPLLAMPVLPATLLLMLVVVWSLLAVLGGTVFHGHHFHLDGHVDGDASDMFSSLGSFTLKWLNLNEMPLVIWLSLFSLLWWGISVFFLIAVDVPLLGKPGTLWSIVLIARNLVFAGLLTN